MIQSIIYHLTFNVIIIIIIIIVIIITVIVVIIWFSSLPQIHECEEKNSELNNWTQDHCKQYNKIKLFISQLAIFLLIYVIVQYLDVDFF